MSDKIRVIWDASKTKKSNKTHFECFEFDFDYGCLLTFEKGDESLAFQYININHIIYNKGDSSTSEMIHIEFSTNWHVSITGRGLKPIFEGIVDRRVSKVSCAAVNESDDGSMESFISSIDPKSFAG
jgi:hypothetical protein